MKTIIYAILYVIVTPFWWFVMQFDNVLSKLYMHISIKLMESRIESTIKTKTIVMNKYRIIEIKDHLGFAWYVPQKFCLNCWQDISSGWNKKEAAMESIRRDITQKVVWEGTEEEVLRPMQEWQKEFNDNDEII